MLMHDVLISGNKTLEELSDKLHKTAVLDTEPTHASDTFDRMTRETMRELERQALVQKYRHW